MATLGFTFLVFLFLSSSFILSHAAPSNNDSINESSSDRSPTFINLCVLPVGSVSGEWYYQSIGSSSKYASCTTDHEKFGAWTMLNAYRSGGKKNTHWQYIEDGDLTKCLKNWSYYDKSGKKLIAQIDGYSTVLGDKKKKPWCATSVYRKGGERGYQWEYCLCPRGMNYQ